MARISLSLVLCFLLVAGASSVQGELVASKAAASGALGLKLIDQKIANLQKKRDFNRGKATAYRKEGQRLESRKFSSGRTRYARARYYEEVAREAEQEIERLKSVRARYGRGPEETVE